MDNEIKKYAKLLGVDISDAQARLPTPVAPDPSIFMLPQTSFNNNGSLFPIMSSEQRQRAMTTPWVGRAVLELRDISFTREELEGVGSGSDAIDATIWAMKALAVEMENKKMVETLTLPVVSTIGGGTNHDEYTPPILRQPEIRLYDEPGVDPRWESGIRGYDDVAIPCLRFLRARPRELFQDLITIGRVNKTGLANYTALGEIIRSAYDRDGNVLDGVYGMRSDRLLHITCPRCKRHNRIAETQMRTWLISDSVPPVPPHNRCCEVMWNELYALIFNLRWNDGSVVHPRDLSILDIHLTWRQFCGRLCGRQVTSWPLKTMLGVEHRSAMLVHPLFICLHAAIWCAQPTTRLLVRDWLSSSRKIFISQDQADLLAFLGHSIVEGVESADILAGIDLLDAAMHTFAENVRL